MRNIGEVIHFYPENMNVIVVMSNEGGIRYIDPDNLHFDDNGCLITTYVSNDVMDEWSTSHGTIRELAELSKFVKNTFGNVS